MQVKIKIPHAVAQSQILSEIKGNNQRFRLVGAWFDSGGQIVHN